PHHGASRYGTRRSRRVESGTDRLVLRGSRTLARLLRRTLARIRQHVRIEKVAAGGEQRAKDHAFFPFRAELHISLPGSARTNVSSRSVNVSRLPVDFGVATIFEIIRKRGDLSSMLISFARFAYCASYTSEIVICQSVSEPSTGSRLMESPFGVTPASC